MKQAKLFIVLGLKMSSNAKAMELLSMLQEQNPKDCVTLVLREEQLTQIMSWHEIEKFGELKTVHVGQYLGYYYEVEITLKNCD